MKLNNFKANVKQESEESQPEPQDEHTLTKRSNRKKLTTIQSLHFQNSQNGLSKDEIHQRNMMYHTPFSTHEEDDYDESQPQQAAQPEPQPQDQSPPPPPQNQRIKNFQAKVLIDFPPSRHYRHPLLSQRASTEPQWDIVERYQSKKTHTGWLLAGAIAIILLFIFLRRKK